MPDWIPGDPLPGPDDPPGFQRLALAADDFELFLGGAKGPGKTDIVILKHLAWVHVPHGLAMLFRETFAEAQELIDRLLRLTDKFPAAMQPAYVGSPRPRFYWPSGHITEIGQCRHLADARKTQGRQPWYVGYDELGNQPDERVADVLIQEIRTPVPELAAHRQFVGSGNPGKPGHGWTKARYVSPSQRGARRIPVDVRLPNGETHRYYRRFIPGFVWSNPVYRRDQQYLAQLMAQTEQVQRQMVFGDYDAATGLAFDELSESVHLIQPFPVPASWERFYGHDWGFAHPMVAVECVLTPDREVIVTDALWLHRVKDRAQARQLVEQWAAIREARVYSGGDAFSGTEAKRDDTTESTAARYAECGVHLMRANDSPRARRRALRELFSWRGGPGQADHRPRCYFFNRPRVVAGFRQLQGLVEDERDPERVQKVDADPITGKGGDDFYDALGKAICTHLPETAEERDPWAAGVPSQDALEWLRRVRGVSGAHEPQRVIELLD